MFFRTRDLLLIIAGIIYRQKRVRFPKGKKLKPGDEKVDVWKHAENDQSAKNDARLAAKERAMRRNEIAAELFTEENRGMLSDISAAEVHYEVSLSIFLCAC